jgi:glycosyltransferase involved in cell wall biosynthesis
MNKDTYVIIPAFNEGKVIRNVLTKVFRSFENVVVVDDGSSDDTVAEVNQTRAILVVHPINLGQGAALQTGMERALKDKDAKYFITFDSDGQHRVEDAENMLETLKKEKLDVVLGSRFLDSKSEEKIPALKRIVLKTAVIFTNRTSKIKLSDTHNGLRVFNRKFAENLNLKEAGYAHGSEIISRIGKGGYAYKEIPVTIDYTEHSIKKGQSMLNSVNILFDLLLGVLRKD